MMKRELTATITRVEHYGLYLETAEGPALVLIPDISREPISDWGAIYAPGDEVRVRLLRYVPDHGLHKATMVWEAGDG